MGTRTKKRQRPILDMERIKRELPNYGDILDEKYGKEGTPTREQFNKEALDFYASQIVLHNRLDAKITQKELAEKTGIDKSYISRIENGIIQPTVSTFMRLIGAMGKGIEIV